MVKILHAEAERQADFAANGDVRIAGMFEIAFIGGQQFMLRIGPVVRDKGHHGMDIIEGVKRVPGRWLPFFSQMFLSCSGVDAEQP